MNEIEKELEKVFNQFYFFIFIYLFQFLYNRDYQNHLIEMLHLMNVLMH